MKNNYRADDINERLNNAGYHPLDIMVTGVTGAGKSSTLNMLFEKEVAAVGRRADPQTMDVSSYLYTQNIRLWDTPGLGDGVSIDRIHEKKLIDTLYMTYEMDGNIYGLVDVVLVIIEGSRRDLGTTYHLINDILVPNIQKRRILVAINKADTAKNGPHFDYNRCLPDNALKAFLEEQAISVQKRILEATGVKIIRPVYYSAEYNYNVKALYNMIVDHIPKSRRELMRD